MDSNRQNQNILIVEDDPLLAVTLRRQVEKLAPMATVHAVDSCADAETSWSTMQPDLVLMDYRLPDGFGTNVIQNMRKQDTHARVICMTAESESIPETLCFSLKIHAVYTKPVPREQIENILKPPPLPDPCTAPILANRTTRHLGRFRLMTWRGPMTVPRIKRLARAIRNHKQHWLVLETQTSPADEDTREALFAFASWLSANGGRLCLLAANPTVATKLQESVAMLIDVFTTSEHVRADQLRLTGFAERQLLLQALRKEPSA